MAATIKIKNSSTAGAAPTSSDLVQGELAVNVTDKRLYTENASGTVVELGTNPSVPVTFPDGSASAPSLTNDGDTNTGLFFPAADTVGITTGGTERARVDSSGNLGLGVTPSAWGTLKALEFTGATSVAADGTSIQLTCNAYYNGTNWIYKNSAGAGNYYINNNTHVWRIAGSGTAGNAITFTQAMTLDASGNLGIGTTSPSYRLTAAGASTAGSVTALAIENPSTNAASEVRQEFRAGGTTWAYLTSSYNSNSPYLAFGVNSAERARIDSSGNLLVGQTSSGVVNANGIALIGPSGGQAINHVSGTGSGSVYMYYGYNGSTIGSITQNGTTGVLYNLTSDYRLKNDPQPLTGAKEFVMSLQPKKWQWWDGSGEGVGFIAHEFMEVAKYSGNGEKDAVDENGNPVYQSIQPSSSEVMANLVSLLQEQQTIITQLQADVAALKG